MSDPDKPTVTPEEIAAFDKLQRLFYPWTVSAESTISDWFGWRFECGGPDDEIGWLYAFLRDVVGLTASEEDLLEFLQYRGSEKNGCRSVWENTRELTLGAFSVWILDHCDLVTVAPFSVCGRSCEPGGVYLALERIASRISPDAPSFGPSTNLLEVLPLDDVWKFWEAASIAANKPMPDFRSYHSIVTLYVVFTLAIAFCILVTHSMSLVFIGKSLFASIGGWDLIVFEFGFFATVFLATKVAAFGDSLRNPDDCLPKRITNFGDLARHLAQTA